jgi:tetratricopeptide (TPR) repeat protein
MQKRKVIAGLIVLAIGIGVLSAGFQMLLYERDVRQAIAVYNDGNEIEAQIILEQLVESPFSDLKLRYNLGMALLHGKAFDKAMAQFRRTARASQNPKLQAQAYYLMAWTKVLEAAAYYWRTDPAQQHQEALGYLEEALKLDPSHKGAKNLYERIRRLFEQPPPENQKPKQDPGTQRPGVENREPKP